ncbi:SGNH/GDSL hydrolase family protein [Sphingomonas sp.]|uniref:SGNH/GDSL hydrolase family protein n=1 Tax=Sphingomonas sp. TaxID=28214 RepID=UPI002D7F896A|nr:SGNH/GDSL hydrolase family protein [Sphingomonas sp.]HEU0045061.1 SGNH/GDSL hydrolase family protein [Sphingomonas sp.]
MLVLLLAMALLELGTRATRIADTPLYLADNRIGYIPRPNQSGRFLWTHDWSFNELSMGTSRPFRPAPSSILLIGDSIVFGGNPYTANERLGPQLAAVTGRDVWPIGAGSWSLQNELQYLIDNPRVTSGVDQVVLVANSEDFAGPSSWANEITHPKSRHWSAAWQALQRYVFRPETPKASLHLQVPLADPSKQTQLVLRRLRRPLIVVVYPTLREAVTRSSCAFQPPAPLRHQSVRLLCINTAKGWRSDYYRDDIHPTVEGYGRLARIIAASL